MEPEEMVDDYPTQATTGESESSSQEETSYWVQTDPDVFNLFRQYRTSFPMYDPENMAYFGQFCDAPTFKGTPEDQKPWYSGITSLLSTASDQYFALFLNASTYHLMNWFYNSSSSKSLGDVDRLVNDVLLAEDFNREELRGFNAGQEGRQMDGTQARLESAEFSASDGWHETSLEIPLSCEKVQFSSEAAAPTFTVHGLYYRKLTEVIKSVYEEVMAKSFHMAPFKLFWQPDPNQPPECIISEIYTADAMLAEQEHIPQVPGCTLEMVVAAIMLCSQTLGMLPYGQYICLLEISPSILVRSQPHSLHITWHIFPRYAKH